MSRLLQLLTRWTREEESALRKYLFGKTASQRLSGLRQSKRVEAKILLITIVPFMLLGISGQALGSGTFGQRLLLAAAIVWALVGLAAFLFISMRSLIRAAKRGDG